jgi:hypothetical protein
MKRLIILFSLCLFACNEHHKQQRAENLVKEFLDTAVKKYQGIKFDKLDTLRSSYLNDEKYKKLKKTFDSLIASKLKNSPKYVLNAHSIKDSTNGRLDIETIALIKMHNYAYHYKGKPTGWYIMHTYKANNEAGVQETGKLLFFLNNDVTKIDSSMVP